MKRYLGPALARCSPCCCAPAVADAKPSKFAAKITRTKYGVPHIKAKTWQGLGFRLRLRVCRGQHLHDRRLLRDRRRASARATSAPTRPGSSPATAPSTATSTPTSTSRASTTLGIVEDLMTRPPPEGPEPAAEEGRPRLRRRLQRLPARHRASTTSPTRAAGAPNWVRPITELDVYRRFHQLGSLASSGAAITGIGAAAPAARRAGPSQRRAEQQDALRQLADRRGRGLLPSRYRLERDRARQPGDPQRRRAWSSATRTSPGTAPSACTRRRLTIPGKLDVSGGSLYGVPAVLIGQNRDLAWSHTVASAWRFTPFQLTLVPGDPALLHRRRPGQGDEAGRADGEGAHRGRQRWRTYRGRSTRPTTGRCSPRSSASRCSRGRPAQGYALGDVNYENFRYLNHFLETDQREVGARLRPDRARDPGHPMGQQHRRRPQGHAPTTRWTARSRTSPTRRRPSARARSGVAVFPLTGIPVLDGSRSECNWDTDPDAVVPGIFGPASDPPPLPPRLRRERQRQPLALQPASSR